MRAALSPVPVRVRVHDAEPFPLTTQTTISGEAAAAGTLRSLLQARTGRQPALVASGAIRLHIEGGGTPESYRLVVGSAGISVIGHDAAGLFYGVQTLGQLVESAPGGWRVPAVEIDDFPRFAYRGVMLDVARHFFDVQTVTAVIDRAASLKLNHLHLHLTDDQGWRLAVESWPKLTEQGSASAVRGDRGGYYSKEDYRRIVEYAAERHMTVVPEIDMPGHTHAIGLAYPELVQDPALSPGMAAEIAQGRQPSPRKGVGYQGTAVGFSSLRIHDPRTYEFLHAVLAEVAEGTPGPFLHIGGDEALSTDAGDFAAFMQRASAIASSHGKVVVAWHEAGAVPGLVAGAVGQYWGSVNPADGADRKALAFVERGGRVILSPSDAVYLDMKYDADTPIGLDWANGPTSVRRSYEWEPSDVIRGLPEEAILGVEAPLWTETVSSLADIDHMMFPRVASAAEAAWSPATIENEWRTWGSFRQRIAGLGPLWKSMGIGFFRSPEVPWADSDRASAPPAGL
ncbi:beta-N-acetylhexosaminidase [Microbacterium sp. dk485]|uniref:family 20 glycosylhydrolase n=1 Tax=Microbacterium sp. dk485 TaxID=2560021 RepID=UPI001073B4DD|nr:family 20 glycosylhydrolase [Microbacterium sp. dk485]TFV85027.1 beta-N-acetylhexosaminidase [Microbacterium sp. dk485]